jgi:hypothetical protein
MRLRRCLSWLTALALVGCPAVGVAQPGQTGALQTLAQQEAQLLAIHHRLASAAADWCVAQPLTGILLRDVRQYSTDMQPVVRAAFDLSPGSMIYIAAVVPGSAADRAALRVGEAVAGINGTPLDPAQGQVNRAFLDEAEAAMGRSEVFRVTISGDVVDRSWTGEPGCGADVQVAPARSRWPVTDGRRISLPPSLFSRVGESGVIASVAHELAHIILRHAAQRAAEGRLPSSARQAAAHDREFAADRLAIWLLSRAGYDPQSMVNLLRLEGQQSGNAERRYPRHPAWGERTRRAEAELAAMQARRAVDPNARPDDLPPL